jgi:hypothetical protein
MKITITQNNLKYEKEIPTCWEEVTFKQFVEMAECGDDYAKLLSVFTGIDPEILRKAKIYSLDSIIRVLQFLGTKPADVVPKTILGYNIPKDLGTESIQQFEDLKKEIRDSKDMEAKDQLLKYPLYVATYCCAQEYGEYDWKRAENMAKRFENAPALEVLAVGNFTLMKLIELKFNIKDFYRKPNTHKKNWRLALSVWVRHMVFSVRLFLWKRKHSTDGKTF